MSPTGCLYVHAEAPSRSVAVCRDDTRGGRRADQLMPLVSRPSDASTPSSLSPSPVRGLYRRLGVERRPSSLLSTRAMRAAIAGQTRRARDRSTKRGALLLALCAVRRGRWGRPAVGLAG